MPSICGANCANCPMQNTCSGCRETNGRPFGLPCVVAESCLQGGEEAFLALKAQLVREFNALHIPGLGKVKTLFPLCGAFINMEYSLPNGERFKLLDDRKIYLGWQKQIKDSARCIGLAADEDHLLVCEYDANGADPEIIIYKKRC